MWLAVDPHDPNIMYASVVNSLEGGMIRFEEYSGWGGCNMDEALSASADSGHPFNIRVLDNGSLLASYSARARRALWVHQQFGGVPQQRRRRFLGRSHSAFDALLDKGCRGRPVRQVAEHLAGQRLQRIGRELANARRTLQDNRPRAELVRYSTFHRSLPTRIM